MITLLSLAFAEIPQWADFGHVPEPKDPYAGEVTAAPVPTWWVQLPGPSMNSASHTERGRPTVHGDEILIGSAAGQGLYRISRRDGGLLGSYASGASVEAAPTVVDDKVVFTDTSGKTWCYTLAGEHLWTHKTTAPILTSPTVADGRVFITNVADLVVAIDLSDGSQVWRHQAKRDVTRLAELALYAAPSAVVDGDEVLVGFSTGDLLGLHVETGEILWNVPVGEGRYPDLVGTPVLEQTDILVGGYFKPLLALDRKSQSVRWRAEVGAAFPVGVADGLVLHPGTDGVLRAYDRLTGAEQWSWDSKTGTALTEPIPTAAGVLVGAVASGVYLIDLETGKKLWRWREPMLLEGVNATPTIAGRQILVVTNAGRLYSLVSPNTPARERPTNRRLFKGDR